MCQGTKTLGRMYFYHLSFINFLNLFRLGSIASSASDVRSYYKTNFGPMNTEFVIANHTFVGLDAPGLVDEDYQRHAKHATFEEWKAIPNGPVSFVKEVSGCASNSHFRIKLWLFFV